MYACLLRMDARGESCRHSQHERLAMHARLKGLRVLISELVVEVLAHFFEDWGGDFRELDLS